MVFIEIHYFYSDFSPLAIFQLSTESFFCTCDNTDPLVAMIRNNVLLENKDLVLLLRVMFHFYWYPSSKENMKKKLSKKFLVSTVGKRIFQWYVSNYIQIYCCSNKL